MLSTICLSTSLDNDIDANQSGTELTFDYQWKFALQHIDDVCPSQNGLGVFLPGPGPGWTNEEKQKGLAVLSQVKAPKFWMM